jgi:hypothetical protein
MIVSIPSPYYVIKENILSDSVMNFGKYKNNEIEKILKLYEQKELSEEEAFMKISQIISDDVPFIVLGSLFYNPVSRKSFPVKGRAISPNYIRFHESI